MERWYPIPGQVTVPLPRLVPFSPFSVLLPEGESEDTFPLFIYLSFRMLLPTSTLHL